MNRNPEPIELFQQWYSKEVELTTVRISSACCLSTIGTDGFPNARFLALKEVSSGAFVVTGNLSSRKGVELLDCKNVALTFGWPDRKAQITEYQTFEGMSARSTETESTCRLIRTRFVYIIIATVVVIAGLASRRYRQQLPAFLAEYAGETLWALLLLFLLVSTLLAGRPVLARAAISLALAFLVEISQLYHAPWIDSIRQSTLGGLVLGFGFLWTDLVCYSVGIALGLVVESAVADRIQRTKEAR